MSMKTEIEDLKRRMIRVETLLWVIGIKVGIDAFGTYVPPILNFIRAII